MLCEMCGIFLCFQKKKKILLNNNNNKKQSFTARAEHFTQSTKASTFIKVQHKK